MFSIRKKRQETDLENESTELSQLDIKEILRTIPHNKAFFFYRDIEKPIGQIATSLIDFRSKINIVPSSSLAFHMKRKDFENWIRKIIRDPELAMRISNINPNDFDLKMKLYSTINTRVKELREKLSTQIFTSNDVVVSSEQPKVEFTK